MTNTVNSKFSFSQLHTTADYFLQAGDFNKAGTKYSDSAMELCLN